MRMRNRVLVRSKERAGSRNVFTYLVKLKHRVVTIINNHDLTFKNALPFELTVTVNSERMLHPFVHGSSIIGGISSAFREDLNTIIPLA